MREPRASPMRPSARDADSDRCYVAESWMQRISCPADSCCGLFASFASAMDARMGDADVCEGLRGIAGDRSAGLRIHRDRPDSGLDPLHGACPPCFNCSKGQLNKVASEPTGTVLAKSAREPAPSGSLVYRNSADSHFCSQRFRKDPVWVIIGWSRGGHLW